MFKFLSHVVWVCHCMLLTTGAMASPQSPTTGQPWVPVLQNKFTPGAEGLGGRYGKFGSAIAIDGNRALVGGEGMSGYGAVLVYEHDGDDWQHTGSLMPSERVLDEKFGHSVALSGDFAVIGVQPEDPTKPGFARAGPEEEGEEHENISLKLSKNFWMITDNIIINSVSLINCIEW